MPVTPRQVKSAIKTLLQNNPQGMRSTELFKAVKKKFPDTTPGQFVGVLRGLRLRQNSDIERISRGLYRHTGSKHKGDVAEQKNYREEKGDGEKIFYQPFADYLVNGEECTKAKVLGGNRLGLRWSTPDVLGINKSEEFDAVKHWIEIVSAEIKLQTDSQSLITAFGQACAYRLFSHKVYIVVPETSSFQDIDRIESLCLIFGIGLILFNPQNPDVGTFNRKVWAMKHEPDFSYVNDESIGKIIRDIIRG